MLKMDQLGKVLSVFAISVMLVVLNTMVIFWMWHWIVMKIFDAPWINFSQAFALSVLISFLKSKRTLMGHESGEKTMMDVFLENSSWSFTNSFFYLAVGWIASQFL